MAYPLFHERGPRDLPMALLPAQFTEEFPSEGDLVEFKQGLPETKVREAVTAFSNAEGGVILLGVLGDQQWGSFRERRRIEDAARGREPKPASAE